MNPFAAPHATHSRCAPSFLASLTVVVLVAFPTVTFADDASRPAHRSWEARPVVGTLTTAAAAPRCTPSEPLGNPDGFYWTDPFPRGEVVLTFDDGPHPAHTPRVLDLLARHRLPATFFLVGRNISPETYPLVQRMVREGHTLGSHSYNHDVTMASRDQGERTVAYVVAQHQSTQSLIEMALLATSSEDFSGMFVRVFGGKGHRILSSADLRRGSRAFAARHAELLRERSPDRRPYPILLSRPPGGNPYVGNAKPWQKRNYGAALERLGWLNVLWHGESGDTDPERRSDAAFLRENLRRKAQKGGVLLIHDYIRHDVLDAAVGEMVKDSGVRVVPIRRAVERKFGCGAQELRGALAVALGGEAP